MYSKNAAADRKFLKSAPPHGAGWGLLTQVTPPGGEVLGVYPPRHRRP